MNSKLNALGGNNYRMTIGIGLITRHPACFGHDSAAMPDWTVCLDAERALLLLCWVAAKQKNRPFLL